MVRPLLDFVLSQYLTTQVQSCLLRSCINSKYTSLCHMRIFYRLIWAHCIILSHGVIPLIRKSSKSKSKCCFQILGRDYLTYLILTLLNVGVGMCFQPSTVSCDHFLEVHPLVGIRFEFSFFLGGIGCQVPRQLDTVALLDSVDARA